MPTGRPMSNQLHRTLAAYGELIAGITFEGTTMCRPSEVPHPNGAILTILATQKLLTSPSGGGNDGRGGGSRLRTQ